MALGTGYPEQDCGLARALEVVGQRWTLLIIRDCFHGVRRFADLQAHLDISKAVLTDRLAGLVEAGVLERLTTGGHPEYQLTESGLALWPVLHTVSHWGNTYAVGEEGPPRTHRHLVCGAPLDAHGRCPQCAVAPAPQAVGSRAERPRRGPRSDRVARTLGPTHRMLDPIR